MNERGTARCVLCFGVYQCDLSSCELHKNGIKVKLSGQPFRLLTILLDRPGEVVTRRELEEKLWPGQTEIDLADNLNTAVNKIRSALDDQAENPRFIETLPRLGYRFIAKVENQNGNGNVAPFATASQSASAPHVAAPKPAFAHTAAQGPRQIAPDGVLGRLGVRILVAGAVPVGLFALWWFSPLAAPHVVRTDQITFSARIDTPAKPISDGENVYYIQRAGDHWDLMETFLGGGDGRRIEAPGRNAMVLDVSPSRKQFLVGSFDKRDGENALWSLPSQGGTAMRLGNAIASVAVFSPDGKQIAYARGAVLSVMDAHGLNQRKLADLPGDATWLAWSLDGERLRFTMDAAGRPGDSIWEITKAGTDLRQLQLKPPDASGICCGSWTPDGNYYIFTAYQGGQSNIWAVRERGSFWHRSPRGPFQLTFGPNSAVSGTAGRDGTHVFYYAGVWRQEMERLDAQTHQFLPLSAAVNAIQVSYSRDGEWIAYIDPQTHALVHSRRDGSERLQLVASDLHPTFPRWSSDGNWIAFGGASAGHPVRVYVVPAAGGQVESLLDSDLRDGDWSGDGKHLVASRSLGGARSDNCELVIVDIPSRRAEKIPSSEHLAMSRWSPDGRYISATTVDQTQLKLWDVSAKEWRVIAHGEALGISVWSPDAHYLYFQDLLGQGERLYRYDVRSGGTDTVFDFSDFLKSGVSRCALFAVTPDGAPIVGFSRSAYDLLAAEVALP